MAQRTRDEQGRQVLVLEETDDELGMTITDGAIYAFRGGHYVAKIQPTDADDLASFTREPDPRGTGPVMWLERDGSLTTYLGKGLEWGTYHDLERIDA